ncbi:VCBS repeat-containing protein [candidate division WOR-3 bacterium]|nr:VCBS repeat-containing protein [candidate division WOR-3 bacterium]
MRLLCGQAVWTLLLVVSVFAPLPALASIPLPFSPSWTSHDNDYSTGGALADVNGDGWLDFLISNGNDMAMDRNSVYMNNLGTLDTIASWRSSDNGYFGHCYAGDVNNDGFPDLAVAYLGRNGGGELTARIYLNDSGTLGTSPWWKAHDQHSSFDCCLGDVDLDGDLDLAITAGDAYHSETDSVRIYRNNSGTFDTLPFWTAHEGTASDAIRFCDIDNDGDLDLFVGQVLSGLTQGLISMYRNNDGTLEDAPSWIARQGVGWVLRLAFGDYDGDTYLDLAVASNNQYGGGSNSIKVFRNNAGTLDTVAAFTMLRSNRYSSCVAWADVNGDEYLDLAAGGWWEPAVVFENHAGVLDTTPAWSWSPSPATDLVCEAVVWGDITNGHLSSVNESYSGDGTRKLFNIHRRPLQVLDSIYVEGARMPVVGYCFDLLAGWVSFASAPPAGTNNIVLYYRYSEAPDLTVTNWDAPHGNYLLLNTTPAAVTETPKLLAASRLVAWPNPAAGQMKIDAYCRTAGDRRTVMTIHDVAGRVRRTLVSNSGSWTWDGCDKAGRIVEPGVYFAALGAGKPALKLVRVSSN